MIYSKEAFKEAFKVTIGHEGGYVNRGDDRGGETKYGVSSKWYPDLDIKNLTLADAEAIYKKEYWDVKNLRLGNIENEAIAIELFDTAVNMGPRTAGRMLQEALNLMNRDGKKFPDLSVDGSIGPNTLITMEKVDPKVLLKVLNGLQFMKYVEIVRNDPEQEINFVGWMKRVN